MLGANQERKVYEGILLQINEIVSQQNLRAGDKLPSERELSEQLGVGRSSVREALRALELLGLIETRRGEGTFLKHYRHNRLIDILGYFLLRDFKTKKDVLEMRKILELEAVRLACKRATPKYLEEMERNLQQTAERLNRGEYPWEEDYQFHRIVCRASRNSILHRIWTPLMEFGEGVRKEIGEEAEQGRKLLAEHTKIAEAIISKNEIAAVEYMKNHLENSND
ncbi:FadR/GntR family transcriptional regulator [Brevibacillus fulvus]|uniref:GntR family transcriptional repressor for pyruvate dehydrogenase complex n=1 Tax=Brevibacillus fulvus TaxID=1125967 RepID=A0A939BTM3_9BACL|nr:FadR/GntR family transcriptional regulator [Brevibacillus fulvus]MBM7591663.1 GntR family transcriptional repressor for pyruvate dehydrogenase complex [Brevibacillus fulvus]